jgi:hypothetical protein
MKNLQYCLCALIITLTACTTLPQVVPQGENTSILGISVDVNRIMFSPYPHSIYFIKLGDKESSYMSDGTFLPSNYQQDCQYYLLNAEPGRYIAVAAFKGSLTKDAAGNTVKESPDDTVYYFPIEMVQLTDIKFKAGESAFMGSYKVDLPLNFKYGMKNPDELQTYYCKRLQPNKAEPNALGCCIETFTFIGGGTGEKAEVVKLKNKDRDTKAEIEFWTKAKKHFRDSSIEALQDKDQAANLKIWQTIIDRKLKKISGEQADTE